ncbi:LysR family transcriptional regulator [Facklamia sp. DSM 111018]|uniref:LysR family transcriptional regulator n=1 Tax=Facklamia lactis TaxID=2749967 RepID=A0ABS0LNK3_9LACT|nr:LysR family transcriptional regulator [Facklamia lactis]MBG9985745.1 LysR family transcriptional regulator [Facklamia lactis]
MNVDNLKRIIEISKTGSISKAAHNLFISQPYLSNVLKETEQEIGFNIFQRTNDGVILTDLGQLFIDQAQQILLKYDEFERMFIGETSKLELLLISARRSSYISIAISSLINHLRAQNIALSVRFSECTNQEVINNIYTANSDIGIIRFDDMYQNHFVNQLTARNIEWYELQRTQRVILISKKNPLAYKKNIFLEDLKGFIEIIHGDFEVNSMDKENHKHKVYVYERGTLLDFVSNIDNSYTWTTATHPQIIEMYDLTERKVVSSQNQVIDYVLYKKENKHHKESRLLLEFIKKAISELTIPY